MFTAFRSSLVIFVLLTIITGVAYPLVITLVAQAVYPHQANGSLVQPLDSKDDGDRTSIRDWWGHYRRFENEAPPIGSVLIGQQFSSARYFWSRPSATAPVPYNAAASSGSNFGPTNPAQWDAVRGRVDAFRKAGHDEHSPIPIDLVTASGSGLDPHISPAAAEYQVSRIARARNVGDEEIRRIVTENTEKRTFGILGEPRVNVLRLNLALDKWERSMSAK